MHSAMAIVLHRVAPTRMSNRKSRPRMDQPHAAPLRVIPHVPRPFDVEERTTRDAEELVGRRFPQAPTGSRSTGHDSRSLSARQENVSANVIPFTKPRAISSAGPVTFSPVSQVPSNGPSWGSQAKAQPPADPANPWGSGSSWGSNSTS